MSITRFSQDSDVYIFEDNGQFILDVSVCRILNENATINEFLYERDKCVQEINHEMAGKRFSYNSIKPLLEKLKYLKKEGFIFPDSVFDSLSAYQHS